MAQGDRLAQVSSVPHVETPESRTADERRIAEKAERLLFDLTRLLKEYSVMPDSFIMPDDYSKSVFVNGKFIKSEDELAKDSRLLELKQNKLRSSWFKNTIKRLESAVSDFDIELAPLEKLRTEFKELLRKEDARWLEVLGKTKAELKALSADENELIRISKMARREASEEFRAEKIRLVYGFDALLKEAIKHLKKYNKKTDDQPALHGASAR